MLELLNISWHDLLDPKFYIDLGGLWLLLFIVFAETGLMVGFFLPGDSLLFVAGIYSSELIGSIVEGGVGRYVDGFVGMPVIAGFQVLERFFRLPQT